MTPLFIGSEPVRATTENKGSGSAEEEQKEGLQMVRALPSAAQKKAILSFSKSGNNNLTEAFKDNVVLDYAGVQAKDLDSAARKQLRDLVRLYVSNMNDGHAKVKMSEVEKHIENTRFAWIGETQDDSACSITGSRDRLCWWSLITSGRRTWRVLRKTPNCRRSSIFIA